MIDALSPLVEARIREAQARGEFDGLPGEGRPLRLDDDPLAPVELKSAWRVLCAAGLVGPGTPCDVRMPTSFAAMMALVDRSLAHPSAGLRRGLARDTGLHALRRAWSAAAVRAPRAKKG